MGLGIVVVADVAAVVAVGCWLSWCFAGCLELVLVVVLVQFVVVVVH